MAEARAAVNSWMIACLGSELSRGSPLPAVLEGRPVVLFRDDRGMPVALEDRCAHRNAPLSLGRIVNGRLECAYHGWQYDRSGRAVEVPALPVPEAHDCPYEARSYPAREQEGFVWVSIDDPSPATEPPSFPHLGATGWTSFIMKTLFRAPIEACLENFLDLPHATFLHRYWFRAPTAREVKVKVRTLSDGAEAEFFDEPRERSLVWWFLAPRGGSMRHTDRYIAPRTSRVDYAFPGGLHYVITSSCSPLDSRVTQVYTVISFRYPGLGWLVRLFFKPLSQRIIRQDVGMLDAQYSNVERFGGPVFASTRADLLGRHIAAWRRALAARAPPPAGGDVQDVVIRI